MYLMGTTLFIATSVFLASIHCSGQEKQQWPCVDGALRFASSYGDHMVLQKSPESAVLWGCGPEGAQVTVYLSGPTKQQTLPAAVTKETGMWQVTLNPVEAGGPYKVMATVAESIDKITLNNTVTLVDVLFGDVWLCSGQSNMYFPTSQVFNASEELALASKYPNVRFFMVGSEVSHNELLDLTRVNIPWSVPTEKNLAPFSAVCWLFGRYLFENLKNPIGLIESSSPGTFIESWSSVNALRQCGLENKTDKKFSGSESNSVLWNAMIHPLLNMTIKGAIWYQGEANSLYQTDQYCSFPAMIDDWRNAFHTGSGGQTSIDFPFGFVQLCTADTGFVPNPRMKRTFMAVAIDLPDETSPYKSIHPRDKQEVAYRLTLGARAVAYNQNNVSFQGPFPITVSIKMPIYVHVTYNKPVSVTPSDDIFEICCSTSASSCGPDSNWFSAPILQSDKFTIQLSSSLCPSTDQVVALRYAWRDWPCDFKACPVYSSDSTLPAPPFIIHI